MLQWKAHNRMFYLILSFQFVTLLSNLITELDPLIKIKRQPMSCPQFSPVMESQTW